MPIITLGNEAPRGGKYGKVVKSEVTSWTATKRDGTEFSLWGLRLHLVDEDGEAWTSGSGEPMFAEYHAPKNGDNKVSPNSRFAAFMRIVCDNYGWDIERFDTDTLVGEIFRFQPRGKWYYNVEDKSQFGEYWWMPISHIGKDGEATPLTNTPQFEPIDNDPGAPAGTSDSNDSSGSQMLTKNQAVGQMDDVVEKYSDVGFAAAVQQLEKDSDFEGLPKALQKYNLYGQLAGMFK